MLSIDKAGSYQTAEKQVNVITEGEVVLYLNGDCQIDVQAERQTKLHLVNRQSGKLKVVCQISGNLVLTATHLDCGELDLYLAAELLAPEARIKTVSATISGSDSHLEYTINHCENATYSEVNNYGIGLADCGYDCVIKARIPKGSKGSEAYQNTRILTAGTVDKVKVLPILQMEENEIKAKHACSIGRLDQEQKYYLAMRGLDETAVLQLTAKGYLSNILREITDKKLSEELTELIESQVINICTM